MRTLHARLLAMALTIVVLISSTMVASAAEVETNEGEEVSIVNVEMHLLLRSPSMISKRFNTEIPQQAKHLTLEALL